MALTSEGSPRTEALDSIRTAGAWPESKLLVGAVQDCVDVTDGPAWKSRRGLVESSHQRFPLTDFGTVCPHGGRGHG